MPVFKGMEFYHYMYSHSRIEGYHCDKRDDFIRAVQMIAWLMNDRAEAWTFEETLMKTNASDLMNWKKNGFWFEIPGSIHHAEHHFQLYANILQTYLG